MASLVEKLRRARESTVATGGFVFTFRRPTDLEMLRIKAANQAEAVLPFVVGWAKTDGSPVTEVDLGLEHGEPHPLAFDAEACADFLADRSDLFREVLHAVTAAYAGHTAAVKEAAKN